MLGAAAEHPPHGRRLVIRHTVVGWSDDCELLEILIPAEHETVNDS
jgi:hypothetical protein